jgi:hypothetical protein
MSWIVDEYANEWVALGVAGNIRPGRVSDRHSVHKAKKVPKWQADHEAKIRLFFLLCYSPPLNLAELASCGFRAGCGQGVQTVTHEALRRNLKEGLDSELIFEPESAGRAACLVPVLQRLKNISGDQG